MQLQSARLENDDCHLHFVFAKVLHSRMLVSVLHGWQNFTYLLCVCFLLLFDSRRVGLAVTHELSNLVVTLDGPLVALVLQLGAVVGSQDETNVL